MIAGGRGVIRRWFFVGAYRIRPSDALIRANDRPMTGYLWGVCDTPLHQWHFRHWIFVGAYRIRPSDALIRADDCPMAGYLWGVFDTPLHQWHFRHWIFVGAKDFSPLRLSGRLIDGRRWGFRHWFFGGAYRIRPSDALTGANDCPMARYLWGVCDTPLQRGIFRRPERAMDECLIVNY